LVNSPEPDSVDSAEPDSVDSPEPDSVDSPEPDSVDSPEPDSVNSPEPDSVDSPEPDSVDSPKYSFTARSDTAFNAVAGRLSLRLAEYHDSNKLGKKGDRSLFPPKLYSGAGPGNCSRNTRFKTLPLAFLGITSMKAAPFGNLNLASLPSQC